MPIRWSLNLKSCLSIKVLVYDWSWYLYYICTPLFVFRIDCISFFLQWLFRSCCCNLWDTSRCCQNQNNEPANQKWKVSKAVLFLPGSKCLLAHLEKSDKFWHSGLSLWSRSVAKYSHVILCLSGQELHNWCETESLHSLIYYTGILKYFNAAIFCKYTTTLYHKNYL